MTPLDHARDVFAGLVIAALLGLMLGCALAGVNVLGWVR